MNQPVAYGVMGGTFDPIHLGHLVAASEVAHVHELDRVVFVPAGAPWQKAGGVVASAEDRFEMTVMATATNERFTVSRVDIDRPGATYAVDTMRDLTEQHPEATQWRFIVGADALANVPQWRDVDKFLHYAQLVAVTRPGYEMAYSGPKPESVSFLPVPQVSVSSSEIRERVSRGQPVRYLVPDSVEHHITRSGLYRDRS